VRYILDTNIWVELARRRLSCNALRGKPGVQIALAPLAIIELVTGLIRGGETRFADNKAMIACMAQGQPEILELPRIFVNRLIWNLPPSGSSGVRPEHYMLLMNLVLQSNSLADFLAKAEASESLWKRMTHLHSIHESVLDKELASLRTLSERAHVKSLPVHMTWLYRSGGMLPDPDWFTAKFSAAIEFLISSIVQVRNGANPQKNNRGVYVDSQFFWYLGDPDLTIVSEEDFSPEIKVSPQTARIISLNAFLRL
jgi:hypothetical protein